MNPTDLPEPKRVQVKDAPKRIWLNVGDLWDVGHDEDVDFHDLGEVSWCDAKQDRDDIEYVRAEESASALQDLQGKLTAAVTKYDGKIEELDEARTQIADLRRQLDEARAEIQRLSVIPPSTSQ